MQNETSGSGAGSTPAPGWGVGEVVHALRQMTDSDRYRVAEALAFKERLYTGDKNPNQNGGSLSLAGQSLPAPSRQAFGIDGLPSEPLTLQNIDEAMRYQPWMPDQLAVGEVITEALTAAAKAILRYAPSSPRRTLALQHIISARMDVNAAISFRGRF